MTHCASLDILLYIFFLMQPPVLFFEESISVGDSGVSTIRRVMKKVNYPPLKLIVTLNIGNLSPFWTPHFDFILLEVVSVDPFWLGCVVMV